MVESLDGLLSETAIRDVQRRYCRGVDRLDFGLVRACFHGDAELDYGHYVGGVDGFIEMAEAGLTSAYTSTTHFIGNQLVELAGYDESAWAEHYVVATHRCPEEGGVPENDFICNFRYVDRMERRGGEWRIARRILLIDNWRRVPIADLGPGPTMKPGSRDRRDPSFSWR